MSSARLLKYVRERAEGIARIVLATLQLFAIAWFSPGRGLPLDDAWIHQVVARTFAETGTLGYAPGHHGAAATSYLWAALLAIDFSVLHLDPGVWAMLLNCGAAVASGQLLYSLLRRAHPTAHVASTREWNIIAYVIAFFACSSPNVLWFVCSGMEAMPFVALSLLAIWASTHPVEGSGAARAPGVDDEERPSLRYPLIAGIAAGALALLRPEGAGLGAVLVLYALRARRSAVMATAAPWVATVALYIVSNVAKTGQAMPSTLEGRRWLWFDMSTGLGRVDRALDFFDAWGTRLSSYTFDTSLPVVWIFVAIAAYGAARIVLGAAKGPARNGIALLLAWTLLHAAFYALLLPTPGHGGRYQPLTPLLFGVCLPLGTMWILRELARILAGAWAEKVRFGALALIGLLPWVALALPTATSLRLANQLAVAHIRGTELEAGKYVAKLPPDAIIASFDIGGIGFASKRRILDLGGLSDKSTSALLQSGKIATWLETNRIRYIVLPQSNEPVLPVFDDYRSRLHLRDNAAIELEPIHVFETQLDEWVPAVKATWNASQKQVVYEVTYTGKTGLREVAPVVPPDARREILDPASFVPRRERVVAEHMLAVLAAWGMPVDIKVTPNEPNMAAVALAAASASATVARGMPGAPEFDLASGGVIHGSGATNATGPCAVRLGSWGFAVDGCKGIGDPTMLRAMLYEDAGRYLDVGDVGGALKAVPHVLVRAKRRFDVQFHPPIAPLMAPIAGGNEATRMGGWIGLGLIFAILGALFLIERAANRNVRLSRLVEIVRLRFAARSKDANVAAVALVLVVCVAGPGTTSCMRHDDVTSAIHRGRGAVEAAIEAGGSVDEVGGNHRVPILTAATHGDPEILSVLLGRGANLDVYAAEGASALHLAARRGHHAAVAVIAATMKTRFADRGGEGVLDGPAGPRQRTALHDAVTAGSIETVHALLAAGASPNKPDTFGLTPAHLLASIEPTHGASIANELRAVNADLTRHDLRGFTPVHAAAIADDVIVLRALIAARFDLVNLRSTTGELPFESAMRYEHDRAAEALLRGGAYVPQPLVPPLHRAARMDAIDHAAALISVGADVTRKYQGKTALEVAAANGSKRVEALLKNNEPTK